MNVSPLRQLVLSERLSGQLTLSARLRGESAGRRGGMGEGVMPYSHSFSKSDPQQAENWAAENGLLAVPEAIGDQSGIRWFYTCPSCKKVATLKSFAKSITGRII